MQQNRDLKSLSSSNDSARSDSSRTVPRIFWVMIGLATVLAIFIMIFLLLRGYQDGQRQADAQRRQQMGIFMQAAEDAVSDGNLQAALDAYRRVLILDPENGTAIAGMNEVVGEISNQANRPVERSAAMPTPPPPMPTPTTTNRIEVVWADAEELYNAGRWEESINRLVQIRVIDSDFKKAEVEDRLFTAYASLASEKINAGGLEEAVVLFDRALELRPDMQEIRTTRDMTARYVDALTYWHADWPKVISLLSDLYQLDPSYRDVRQRLQRAHLEYADNLARQSDWCPAAEQYSEAIAVQNAPGLEQKQDEFETLCAQQPDELAEELAAETTEPGVTSAPIPAATGSLGSGRILYSSRDPVDGRHRVYAQPVTASVRPVMLVEDAMQPDLRSDGQRLVFRNMRGDQRGLGSYDPASELRLRFTFFAEDSQPGWNPEGNRLVFASDREGDRRWRIYTAWADGNDSGASLGYGHEPSWHPQSDRIVFRGCDERGNGCGLWLMNSGGGDRAPLTNVPGDGHPAWSPDGRFVVFMSAERSGNWDLYRVDVQSGVVVQLTDDPAIDGLPAVSPDGSRVAFLSNREGAWKIWVKPLAGGPEQVLAPITGELPDWMAEKIQWVP
jgi:tetratricopeptide (TPR) repeat protein